jgi:hypothetical protein
MEKQLVWSVSFLGEGPSGDGMSMRSRRKRAMLAAPMGTLELLHGHLLRFKRRLIK